MQNFWSWLYMYVSIDRREREASLCYCMITLTQVVLQGRENKGSVTILGREFTIFHAPREIWKQRLCQRTWMSGFCSYCHVFSCCLFPGLSLHRLSEHKWCAFYLLLIFFLHGFSVVRPLRWLEDKRTETEPGIYVHIHTVWLWALASPQNLCHTVSQSRG